MFSAALEYRTIAYFGVPLGPPKRYKPGVVFLTVRGLPKCKAPGKLSKTNQPREAAFEPGGLAGYCLEIKITPEFPDVLPLM